jgi:hypothetical protein
MTLCRDGGPEGSPAIIEVAIIGILRRDLPPDWTDASSFEQIVAETEDGTAVELTADEEQKAAGILMERLREVIESRRG